MRKMKEKSYLVSNNGTHVGQIAFLYATFFYFYFFFSLSLSSYLNTTLHSLFNRYHVIHQNYKYSQIKIFYILISDFPSICGRI